MADWGASGRRDTYSLALVNPRSLGEVRYAWDGLDFEAGKPTLDFALDAECRVSASIGLMADSYVSNLLSTNLLRVKHSVSLPDGESYGETLGTFFIDASKADALHGRVTRNADCYSTLVRFTDDVLAQDFSRPAGYNIVQEVRELVEADGGRLRVLPGVNTDQTHTVPIWFEVGTNRYKVLDQIAQWTLCEIDVDEDGYVTWGPYVEPLMRPLSYTFEDGVNCVYKAGYTLETTSPDAINRVVAHFSRQSKDDDDPYPLSDSCYVDLPETDPFSYEQIGRRKSYDLTVDVPCSHEELVAQATRYLYDHKGSTSYVEFEHVGIPWLRHGQHVKYINNRDSSIGSYYFDGLIEQISMTLGPGCMCNTKVRVL